MVIKHSNVCVTSIFQFKIYFRSTSRTQLTYIYTDPNYISRSIHAYMRKYRKKFQRFVSPKPVIQFFLTHTFRTFHSFFLFSYVTKYTGDMVYNSKRLCLTFFFKVENFQMQKMARIGSPDFESIFMPFRLSTSNPYNFWRNRHFFNLQKRELKLFLSSFNFFLKTVNLSSLG